MFQIDIKMICINMNQHYFNSIQQIFPRLPIAVDSFHVMKNVTKTFHKVRLSIINSYYNDNSTKPQKNNQLRTTN